MSKALHRKYKCYQVCVGGLRCSCVPTPEARRRHYHPKGLRAFYRDADKLERAYSDK